MKTLYCDNILIITHFKDVVANFTTDKETPALLLRLQITSIMDVIFLDVTFEYNIQRGFLFSVFM